MKFHVFDDDDDDDDDDDGHGDGDGDDDDDDDDDIININRLPGMTHDYGPQHTELIIFRVIIENKIYRLKIAEA